jgi:hypothetical protein
MNVIRAALLVCLVLACGNSAIAPQAPADARGNERAAASPDASDRDASTVETGLTLPPLSPDAAEAPPAASCVEESHRGQPVPLDILLLIDRSRSMGQLVGGDRKWDLVRQALLDFTTAPGSAGIGVGVQLFPNAAAKLTCSAQADCESVRTPGVCQSDSACVGGTVAPGEIVPCGDLQPGLAPCPSGSNCRKRGVCARSTRNCFDIGQPCPGAVPEDMCVARPRTCSARLSCEPEDYLSPLVPIAPLPGATAAIAERLIHTDTSGNTPMAAAVAGSLTHLRVHLGLHPDRRAALVIAGDGLPAGCASDLAPIRKSLTDARAGTPPLSTYVIGVSSTASGPEQSALASFATAGGTGDPFLLGGRTDLRQEFLQALNQVRSAALPCQFTIPMPGSGVLDYGKVNVRVTTGAASESLLYTGSPARCHPERGGWHYDVDPAAGRPSLVVLCEASCGRLKSGGTASVDLRFGCKTQVID